MEFLKTRLQGVTGHQLDVTPIFDFLDSLCHGLSQAAKARIDEFHQKWESSSYSKNNKLTVGYITGSWKPPSAARTPELARQKSWESYTNNAFKFNGSASTSSSAPLSSTCAGPFTFKEMIQHEFWKDLYNSFGHKVAAFILEKALLVFEVEENFYMVIASEGCTLHQKLEKAVVRPISRSGGGQPVGLNGSFNPYKLQERTSNYVKLNTSPIRNPHFKSRKRKLSRESTEHEEVSIPSHKKAKIITSDTSTTSTSCLNVQTVTSTNNHSLIQRSEKSTPAENDSGVIRWFRPTSQIVQFLIEEREKIKLLSGLSINSSKPRPEDALSQLHFVGILKNDAFCKIARINVVHKQFRPLDLSKEFRTPEWPGLIIKEPETRGPDRKYNVNVYRISEDFARKNNIRVHAKQRRGRRKKGAGMEPSSQLQMTKNPTLGDVNSSSTTLTTNTIPPDSENSEQMPTTISDFIAKHDAVDPFDPLIFLSTLPALYNKSSWSHWPKSHPITTACSKPLEDGVRFLIEDVLATNVGPPNYYLNNSLVKFKQSSDASSMPLMEIFKKVLGFHKRVKDIHKLVKRCITFWMVKNQEKLAVKAGKAEQRHKWKNGNANYHNNSCEIIDLTVNSQICDATVTPSSNEVAVTSPSGEQLELTTMDHQEQPTMLTASAATTGFHNSSEMKICSGKELRVIVYSKLKEQIPHSCILMMIKHILHLSGMEEALGSKKNLRNFYKFLRKSLILAGTKSSLQLGQMMAQLDSTGCNWMNGSDISVGVKDFLFAKVTKWIFTSYILMLLKTSFYITEVNTSRLHATFYLRESWKSISESVRHRLIKSGTLSHLGLVPARPSSRRRSLLGINSRLRLLPKRNNDMRPIISLKREARNKWDETNAKVIIDYVVRKNSPHRVRDTNFLRQRWLTFLQKWQQLNRPKLYFVRGDIQNAYPSVHVPKLKLILDNVAREFGTMTQKEFRVFSKSRVMYRKAVISWNHPSVWMASIGARPCFVQTNEKHNIVMRPEDVFRKLFPHSNQNVLRIGKHKYDFRKGLPQGWVLSEGYCNIYYGAMDSRHLGEFLNHPGEFFNTSVDDYLYITPNARMAAKFLNKMETGFPSYNCKLNSSKILTNIYPKIGWPLSRQECEWVTFCGWCFCLTCGHIMRDFGAYVGQDMASSLSFIPRNVSSPENFLVARMKMMLPARLHQFMLDPMINCRARITLNIWEAGFIFAFRFYAICRVIYPNLNATKEPKRAKHITAAIIVCARAVSRITLSTFRATYTPNVKHIKCVLDDNALCPCIYSYHDIKRMDNRSDKNTDQIHIRLKHMTSISKEPLQEAEILYTIFHAFMLKLKHHSSVFDQEILPRLNKMKQFQRSLLSNDSCNFLDKVLGNRMPFAFQNIKV